MTFISREKTFPSHFYNHKSDVKYKFINFVEMNRNVANVDALHAIIPTKCPKNDSLHSFQGSCRYSSCVPNSPVDLTVNSSYSTNNNKPENASEGGRTLESPQWICRLLPEEDVPEKQPAWVHQQGYERVDQRTIKGVVQNALRND